MFEALRNKCRPNTEPRRFVKLSIELLRTYVRVSTGGAFYSMYCQPLGDLKRAAPYSIDLEHNVSRTAVLLMG